LLRKIESFFAFIQIRRKPTNQIMSDSDEVLCPICLEDVEEQEHFITCCGHGFHVNCLTTHVSVYKKRHCPCCRHQWCPRGKCPLGKADAKNCTKDGCVSHWVRKSASVLLVVVRRIIVYEKEYFVDDHNVLYDLSTLNEIGVFSFDKKEIVLK